MGEGQQRREDENAAMRAILDKAREGERLSVETVFAEVRKHVAEVAADEMARRKA